MTSSPKAEIAFEWHAKVPKLIWRPLGPSFVDAHKFSRSFIFGDCRPILETFRDLSDAFIANRDK